MALERGTPVLEKTVETTGSEVDRLPERMGMQRESDCLPDRLGTMRESDSLPDKLGTQQEVNIPSDAPAIKESEVEGVKVGGGSYKDVRKFVEDTGHKNKEVHHMPSDWSSPLERNDGPCIEIDREDHRRTASCGKSIEAQEYREKQQELIAQGKFREALQMDIDDIHEKFGDKYDDQIQEMLEYVNKLEQEGKI